MATTLKSQSKAQPTLFPPAPRLGGRRVEFAHPLLRRNSLCSQPAGDSISPISAVEELRISVSSSTYVGFVAGLGALDAGAGLQVGLAEESIPVTRPLMMAAAIEDEDEDEEDEDLDDEDDDLEDEDDLDDEDEDEDDLEDEDEEDEDYDDLDEDDEDEDEDEDDE